MSRYKHMRNYRKSVLLLISVLAMILIVIGVSSAFLKSQTDDLVNTFNSSYVTSKVEESFENDVKSDVKIQNTGDVDAYIRAAVIVTWQDINGNVFPKKPLLGTDYEIEFASDGWDTETTDNYYYYTKPVDSEAYTGVLIEEVKPVDSNTPKGYGLSVEILGDAIQSKPTKAVENSWGVTVNSDGTISK